MRCVPAAFTATLLALASHSLAAQEPAASSGPVLTLVDAVREALLKNDRVLDGDDAVEQANLSVRLARNNFRPKIVPNIQGSFGQTDVINQTYRLDVSQRFLTGTEVRAGIGASTAQIPAAPGSGADDVRFYNTDATLTLTQPLLRGFGRAVNRQALTSAELSNREAGRQRRLTQDAVVVEVAGSYYRILAQEAFVEVARASLDRARKLRDASEAKLDAGLVSQLDVFRAQQLVSAAEVQLLDARAAVEDARDQLRLQLGRTGEMPFQVEWTTVPQPEDIDVEAAITTAVSSRIDLQGARDLAAGSTSDLAYAHNQLLPQVDVNVALTRRVTAPDFTSSFGLDRFQFATFFTIAMPVDRTPQLVALQNALINRDRRQRAVETLQERVSGDVKRAVRDVERLARTLAAAEVAMEIGTREVEVAQFRYERGLSNNLDVITAETSLLNAQGRRLSAQGELAVARLSLRATMGVLDPRRDLIPAAGPVRSAFAP